jgi:uncharacterized protein
MGRTCLSFRLASYEFGEISMRNKLMVALLGLLATCATAPLLAADVNPAEAPNPNDPSVSQVYDAARAGHLDQAKQLMARVLANHPHSSRAHYVAAEIDADMKNYGDARQELKTAEEIDPGLPFANPQAVAELRREIGAASTGAAPSAMRAPVAAMPLVREPTRSIPWGLVAIVAAVVFVIWLLVRRRQAVASRYSPYPPGTMPNASMGPGPVMPPPGGFPSVMGGGSGLVGGLASGLAVGAGIAAGEELVEHAFGRGREVGTPVPEREVGNENPSNVDPNADLGGPDFGVSEGGGGGGWDDGGSSGDGGGGDWT